MAQPQRSTYPRHPTPSANAAPEAPDFAFADTVVALDLDESIPPSGIVVSDSTGSSRCLVPVSYHLPAALEDASFWARIRRGLNASRAEMKVLWTATASLEETHDRSGTVIYHEDPFVRAATVGRRVRTLFSFFEWDRSDLLRATWIGLAVFVLVATVGAIVLENQGTSIESSSDRSSIRR
jgi:hypothetical protein